jgi:hypothetical protein
MLPFVVFVVFLHSLRFCSAFVSSDLVSSCEFAGRERGRVVAFGTLSVYDLFACVCVLLRSPFSYRTYRNNAEAGLQGV